MVEVYKVKTMNTKEVIMLLVMFFVYGIFGGFLFLILEAPNEKKDFANITKNYNDFLNELDSTQKAKIEQIVIELQKTRDLKLVNENGTNIISNNWDLFNSFFFAFTVITTIGYGHLTPSTTAGRIACICYALLGIPMAAILLNAIGERFSAYFLDKVDEIRGRKANYSMAKILVHAFFFFVPWTVMFIVVPSILFTNLEEWDFIEGLYFCFVSLSTIGFGDYVAGNIDATWTWLYKIFLILWVIFGLAYLSMIFNFISHGLKLSHLSLATRFSFRKTEGAKGGQSATHL